MQPYEGAHRVSRRVFQDRCWAGVGWICQMSGPKSDELACPQCGCHTRSAGLWRAPSYGPLLRLLLLLHHGAHGGQTSCPAHLSGAVRLDAAASRRVALSSPSPSPLSRISRRPRVRGKAERWRPDGPRRLGLRIIPLANCLFCVLIGSRSGHEAAGTARHAAGCEVGWLR